MTEIVLTAEEISICRKFIRERYDKDPKTYRDDLVAATISINALPSGRFVSAKQIKIIREEMNLSVVESFLPRKKQSEFPPKQIERKETAMRKRLSPEDANILFEIVKEHTGGEKHLTSQELVKFINENGSTSVNVTINQVNRTRVLLSKGKKPKQKSPGAAVVHEAPPIASACGGVLQMAIAHFRKQRDAIDRTIKNLEECIALETAAVKP